jgi:hypothetical protein
MALGINTRCPVSGDALLMLDEDEWSVGTYHTLAQRYQLSILDICTMLTLAVYGPDVEPETELTERTRELECDAALLKLALPIDEAVAIWLRAREGLQWSAANCPDPERRAKIEAFIAAQEDRMAALRERLERRNAAIAKRRAAHG